MHSIELFNPHAFADGWHSVRAPGGYEWWYFDAEYAATDTQIVAIFMEGFIFHPGYLRAHALYLKRPTRTSPPVAGDFPCVYLCVYRGGKIAHQFFTQYKPSDFRAAVDRVDVQIGPNRLSVDDAGAYRLHLEGTPWVLTGRGPQTLVGQTLSADLTFAPVRPRPAIERSFLSRGMTGAVHEWVIAAPRCRASGMVSVSGGSFMFDGRGYHDHNFGTAPIGEGIARWTWGRAMFGDDRVVTFHHAEPNVKSRPSETHLVVVDDAGVREAPVESVKAIWSQACNPAMRLRFPESIDFGPALRLHAPRVIDPSPFYLRLTFAAESFGQTSTAFCEIAYPHRLRWPILGRMIEMSFDKRPSRE